MIRTFTIELMIFLYGFVVFFCNLIVLEQGRTLLLVNVVAPAIFQEKVTAEVVLDNTVLRTACLTGSFLGAFLAICLWPTTAADTVMSIRQVGAKFLASAITGVAATPMMVRWMGWSLDTDILVGAAFIVSFLSVGVIHRAAPLIPELVVERIRRWFGKQDK
jgi:hypothetical protein